MNNRLIPFVNSAVVTTPADDIYRPSDPGYVNIFFDPIPNPKLMVAVEHDGTVTLASFNPAG